MWFLVSRLEDADVRVWRGLGLFFCVVLWHDDLPH